MKVGIFGSDYQIGKLDRIKKIFERLEALEGEVWVEKNFFNYLNKQFGYVPSIAGIIDTEDFSLDMALSLGGDGTFLRTAAWVGRKNIPILGINTGRLGFLADVDPQDIDNTLDAIFKGEYQIEERSLLQLNAKNQPVDFLGHKYALNEIAVLKRDSSSMITIHTYLNDEFLTDYLADGLLVATPTGSTAYSMSVDGPIIIPQAKNFVLSPVAPHSLNVRPLVIPDDYHIRLEVETRNYNFLVSLDGSSEIFPTGSCFDIQKADFTTKIVKRHNQTFYDTLRKKLMWGTDVRGLENY